MTQINVPLINRRQRLRDRLWEQKLSCIEKLMDQLDNSLDDSACEALLKRLKYIDHLLKWIA